MLVVRCSSVRKRTHGEMTLCWRGCGEVALQQTSTDEARPEGVGRRRRTQWCPWKNSPTGWNNDKVPVPKAVTLTKITAAINATKSAYSALVAPRSEIKFTGQTVMKKHRIA